ncbi:unnamed protein product [Durusdinium trenchii]|uniref:Aspartyl/asparaginy/proline hydroxylase domain-containing protein n=1 Tax=Durusdinium trenchii TaxID=1381693 RepID=A0ABP0S4J6_9DINO
MGQAFGYEGRIREEMQAAIRKEAAHILLSGRYLKASWQRPGPAALAQVLEQIYQHRHAATMFELFRKTAEALPLKYPLSSEYLVMCDLRGCSTVMDVAAIFLERVVAQHLHQEADQRLWSTARAGHGAVSAFCWGISYITCTCCCVGQYEQKIKFPLGGCGCSPKHTSPSRRDLALADLRCAKQGILPLSALAVRCVLERLTSSAPSASAASATSATRYAQEEVNTTSMPLGVLGSEALAASDRPWNWPELRSLYGRHAFATTGYERRQRQREEEAQEAERRSHPYSSFEVLADVENTSCPLKAGDLVHPVEIHPGMLMESATGAHYDMIGEDSEALMVPTSHWWLAMDEILILDAPESLEDPVSWTHLDPRSYRRAVTTASPVPMEQVERLSEELKPEQHQMLAPGDLVRSSEAKLHPEFQAVEPGPKDLIHILTLDGRLIFTVAADDYLLDFPLSSLTRKVSESLHLNALLQLELVPSSGISLDASKPLSSLKAARDASPSGPLELVATLRVTGRLYAPWVPLAGGGVVRAFDEHLAPVLKPIQSPFLHEGLLDLDRQRLFFDGGNSGSGGSAAEFPELGALRSHWLELLEEWQQLWSKHRDQFSAFEGHVGWMSFPLKLWGFDLPRQMALAPKATELMRTCGIQGLTTFTYSVLEPGCHIKPHREHVGTSGVRAHLGLQIPPCCAVRVGPNALKWREGHWTVFNGNRSHEVLNMDRKERVVLLIDFGGPVLKPQRWPKWLQERMEANGVHFEKTEKESEEKDADDPDGAPRRVEVARAAEGQ